MHVGYMKSQNKEREQSTTTTFKLSQFPYLYVFETVNNYEISPIYKLNNLTESARITDTSKTWVIL